MQSLSDVESVLILDLPAGQKKHTVRLVDCLSKALKTWGPLTRVSPIFPVSSPKRKVVTRSNFPGEIYLCFLGPIHPRVAFSILPNNCPVWLTLGLFNTVAQISSPREVNQIKAASDKIHIPWEVWRIKSGQVSQYETSRPNKRTLISRDELADFYLSKGKMELAQALGEYCPLLASAIARSAALPADFGRELEALHKGTVYHLSKLAGKNSAPHALAHLTVLNAGLSRFSSQTFSGASPIAETECHFWLHSLLGIGVASIALRNIRVFVQRVLGEANLAGYLASLGSVTTKVPDLMDQKSWEPSRLSLVLPARKTDSIEIIPLLSYFSGREGYYATETTISAPLAAISACNSRRWSLLTLTHEIMHVIVRPILAKLCGDANDKKNQEKILRLWKSRNTADNLFDEVRRLFIKAIVRAARHDEVAVDEINTYDEIHDCIYQVYYDVEEILVHTLDFLYVYGKDSKKYVRGIWTSWGMVPDVNQRLSEYLVRTISAVWSLYRRRSNGLEDAKKEVQRHLVEMAKSAKGMQHVSDAIDLLSSSWDSEIRPRVLERTQFVKIVEGLLFDVNLATRVRSETHLASGSAMRGGYGLIPKRLEFERIDNPLLFIENFTSDGKESTATSLWIYHVLAFAVDQNEA